MPQPLIVQLRAKNQSQQHGVKAHTHSLRGKDHLSFSFGGRRKQQACCSVLLAGLL